MSGKALIITVGGSDEPVVISIKNHKPDFIYFICSAGKDPKYASTFCVDGQGEPCKRGDKSYPSIIKQTDYKNGYKKIEIEDPDDFLEIYKKTKDAIQEAKDKGFELICDFTAGTKAMSSTLAMLSALDLEIKPYLVKGQRKDLIKTTEGSIPVNLEAQFKEAKVDFLLRIFNEFISKYQFGAGISLLEKILQMGLESNLERKIRKLREIAMAFYLWDIFQYEEAFLNLKNYAGEFKKEFNYLLRICGKDKPNGYELFFDLISNAKRQASMGFYDNAVARLYRALELLAQIRLKKQYGIETNALQKSLDNLKNKEKWEKKKNEEGEIKIGLQDDYELLDELEDPIGKVYKDMKGRFTDTIKIRNLSKLAHGNNPVKEEDWRNFLSFFEEFINKCLEKINLKFEEVEFPKKI